MNELQQTLSNIILSLDEDDNRLALAELQNFAARILMDSKVADKVMSAKIISA